MRILVTGATGFIGRQTLPFLLDKGFEVHAPYVRKPLEEFRDLTWHRVDLMNAENTDELCCKIRATHLLHLAWYVNPKDYKNSTENERWREASLGLFDSFIKSGGTRAVMIGTAMEYDPNVYQDKLSELASPIAPDTRYGIAKNETRIAAARRAKESGVSLSWGRVFNLYGPYEAPGRLVPNIIYSLLSGEKPNLSP